MRFFWITAGTAAHCYGLEPSLLRPAGITPSSGVSAVGELRGN